MTTFFQVYLQPKTLHTTRGTQPEGDREEEILDIRPEWQRLQSTDYELAPVRST